MKPTSRYLNGSPVAMLVVALASLMCSSCAFTKATSVTSLRLVSVYTLPNGYKYGNTTVGGLSGIDYHPPTDTYFIISDDNSGGSPSRFYTARIHISDKIDSVTFTGVYDLLQPNGKTFPATSADPRNSADPEAIRYLPSDNLLAWSSEGERMVRGDTVVLNQPSIHLMSRDGNWIDSFEIPEQVRFHATEYGGRRNGTIEGLAFSPDQRYLFASVEEPLYQDGSRAGTGDSAAFVRILKFDVSKRRAVAQYVYKIDPVVHAPEPPDAFRLNGVTDILMFNENEMLVTERSYSVGRKESNVRVYLANLRNVVPINGQLQLSAHGNFSVVPKKLLLNFDALGIYIDNVEGATFGPILPGGKRSLIFVTDDNFSTGQRTQLLLFEVN